MSAPAVAARSRLAVLPALLGLLASTPSVGQQVPLLDTAGLPPAGVGTLHQEDVAVHLSTANVQLRIIPLDERVIRLLAPDSYESLHRLAATRQTDLDRAAERHRLRHAALFLVTFFGLAPRAPFTPDDVTITSGNRLFRPGAIVPLSPLWSELQLNQRETASALYLYEDGIAILEPLTVAYDGVSSDGWEQTLRDLDRERARVFGRAAAAPASRRP